MCVQHHFDGNCFSVVGYCLSAFNLFKDVDDSVHVNSVLFLYRVELIVSGGNVFCCCEVAVNSVGFDRVVEDGAAL